MQTGEAANADNVKKNIETKINTALFMVLLRWRCLSQRF
jgi:hypothetical protein